MTAPFTFTLPDSLSAKEPPEHRGIPRDRVRLLVIDRQTYAVQHTQFNHIGEFLRSGDLLVFNASRTLPAALTATETTTGMPLQVRLAHRLSDGSWLALLVCEEGQPFACGLNAPMQLQFGADLRATVSDRDSTIPRLWKLRFNQSGAALIEQIYRLGEPIRYEYVAAPWTLGDYQTVYAKAPGSAEMPSAGRAFTWQVLFDLKRRGIEMAQIVLHTGLSSYLDDELDAQHPASCEEYDISAEAAEKINRTRAIGGRIIAVGTTVVRALESVADQTGRVQAGAGYTRLHITQNHTLKTVDGLLTGLHEPEASHLDLLTAFLPPAIVQQTYTDAVDRGYLWHEFGDLNLIL